MSPQFDNPLLVLLDHRLPLGVVGLDRFERVLSRNLAAHAILDERDGLVLVQGRLAASEHEEALALRAVVAAACTHSDSQDGAGGMVRISRRAPRGPVTLFVAPLRWPTLDLPVTVPAALVLVSDPEREPPRLDQRLRRLYGLTRSEVDVALLVLDGARAEDVARQRGTSLNTARTHIKRVLGKVGVQSQVELVRVLLAGALPAAELRPARIDVVDRGSRGVVSGRARGRPASGLVRAAR